MCVICIYKLIVWITKLFLHIGSLAVSTILGLAKLFLHYESMGVSTILTINFTDYVLSALDFTEYIMLNITWIIVFIVGAPFFSYYFINYFNIDGKHGHIKKSKRVLLVLAYPGNESTYFGPIMVRLANKPDCHVFVVCMTKGLKCERQDMSDRMKTFWKGCRKLGISECNITVFNSSHLEYNRRRRWAEDKAANVVLHQVESLQIDTVVTFDERAIDDHASGVSTFYTLAYLVMERMLPKHCRVFSLETVSCFRRYLGFLDVPVSLALAKYYYVVSLRDRCKIKRATNLGWFKCFSMTLSRYSYVSTLKQIEILHLIADKSIELAVDFPQVNEAL